MKTTMNPKYLMKFLLVPILVLLSTVASAALQPQEQVKSAVDQIVSAVKNENLTVAQRRENIRTSIRNNFDFQSMSQSVLATNWKKATPEEQEDFVEYFLQYLESTYMKAIESYTNEEFLYLKEKVRGERALVKTVIKRDTVETPVDYKLRNDGSRWYVYDVVIEGSSLVNTYRNTFSAIVKTEGMQGLLDDLKHRIAKHKSSEVAAP